jgi:hypothetical protein
VSSRINPRSSSPFGNGRNLRLTAFRAAPPRLELEAVRHGRQGREEEVEFGADIGPLARRESGIIWCNLRLDHSQS